MLKNYYKLKISGKDVMRFIKMLYRLNVYFEEIYFDKNSCYIKVDSDSYEKINKIKTSYEIELVNLYGLKKIEEIFKKNFIFILSSILGLVFIYFLSNLIFEIEVVHNDKEIRGIIFDELDKYGIKKYAFVKDYDYLQKVKESILSDNKEKIEWLEIERDGTKYNIRVEKRIINNLKKNDDMKHIVASKSGIIMKIVAENGEVVKKVNDYVKEGDIIISGSIYRNGEVIDNISASGDVYAEVWYKVKVELPISYKEEKLTGNSSNIINIKFLDFDINLFDFDKYKHKNVSEKVLFWDFFNMFSISYNKQMELIVKDEVNNIISEEFAFKLAREKIEKNLGTDEYVISQKKLKTVINNSTIITEIFFKVCENISSPKYYSFEKG